MALFDYLFNLQHQIKLSFPSISSQLQVYSSAYKFPSKCGQLTCPRSITLV